MSTNYQIRTTTEEKKRRNAYLHYTTGASPPIRFVSATDMDDRESIHTCLLDVEEIFQISISEIVRWVITASIQTHMKVTMNMKPLQYARIMTISMILSWWPVWNNNGNADNKIKVRYLSHYFLIIHYLQIRCPTTSGIYRWSNTTYLTFLHSILSCPDGRIIYQGTTFRVFTSAW